MTIFKVIITLKSIYDVLLKINSNKIDEPKKKLNLSCFQVYFKFEYSYLIKCVCSILDDCLWCSQEDSY